MKLINAMRTGDSVTQNGMKTNSSTLNGCVDLFSMIGAVRGEDKQRKINTFVKAFDEDALIAMKILFWVRDVRGGAGERQTAIDLMTYLANNRTEVMFKNIGLIPEYGRWSDVLPLLDTKLSKGVLGLISKALKDGDGNCAKWMPRGNTKNVNGKRWSKIIRNYLNYSPKEYRKLLVGLSNTVEQKMCAGKFDKINYSHVPSKAMSDYMKTFGKRDYERFSKYLNDVKNGKTKINTSAVYPYDVCKNMCLGHKDGADIQWDNLPNYMEGNIEKVMPLVDVSGSMSQPAGRSSKSNVTCMDVAISLGLYISERNTGPFKDAFITFSERPKLQYVKGSLSERYNQMSRSKWGFNTNLTLALKTMLDSAIINEVPSDEMPTMLLILSDMEFDSCTGNWNKSALEMMKDSYESAGYEMPKITFWNINSMNEDNKPAQHNEKGVALVSGFSPAILKTLLSGVFEPESTPYEIMMEVIGSERYEQVTI